MLILFIQSLYSQSNYRAIYQVSFKKINYDSILKNNDKLKIYNNDLYKKRLEKEEMKYNSFSKEIEFILDFNKKESSFFVKKVLENPQKSFRIFMIRLGVKGKYYSTQKMTLHQKNSYGQLFIINTPKYKWEVSSESKKIGKYTCYKATTINNIHNSRGVVSVEIVAWFTPEIPFNFGPKEYNGLPGLIIELKEGFNVFKLKKLIKNDKLVINKPIKGKKLELVEFQMLSRDLSDNMRKQMKRRNKN